MIKRILLVLFFLMCIWSGSICAKSDISYEIDQLEYTDWIGVIIIAKMATDVYLDTSPFDVNLSSTDTNAQIAFETLDELNYVDKSGDTMTGNLIVPEITVSTITAGIGNDLFLRMGDVDGANYVMFIDTDNTNVAGIDSNGDMVVRSFLIGVPGVYYVAGINSNGIIEGASLLTGQIGIPTYDTDLLQLTIDLLTVNGRISVSSATVTNQATVGSLSSSGLIQGTTIYATGTGTFGDLEVDSPTLSVDATNDRVGIGTASPGSKLTVYTTAWDTAGVPLVNITNLDSNATDADGLLVRGGANNSTSDTFKVQDFAGNTDFVVVGNGKVGIGTASPSTKLEVNGTATFTEINASGQVTSNARKLVDQYDYAVCISTPNALSTIATLISPFRSYGVTISTISAQIIGGTNVVFMIEQRTIAGIESAGTDIWSGDVTAVPNVWTGGGLNDFTLPTDRALVLVITSVSGDVDRLMIKYIITKD